MTTKAEIEEWFKRGLQQKATHMLVVCDTFDYGDYPVYVKSDEDCREEYDRCHGKNMQTVMEVYDLRKDMHTQIALPKVLNLPSTPRA